MTQPNAYENLDFEQRINVISHTNMPKHCPLHWHKYIEILAVPVTDNEEHTFIVRIQQNIYHLRPGDILMIWPGELHEITDNSNHELIGIQLTATLLNETKDFSPYLNLFRTFHYLSHKDHPELSAKLCSHLCDMASMKNTGHPFEGVENLISVYKIFMEFASYLNNSLFRHLIPSASKSDKALEKINMTCSYIIENCEQNLTLDIVSSHVGFSSFYLSRLFKKVTNYSFVEYLTLQRIRRAQRYLTESALTITEIAFQSGFKSISTFNRVFHKCKGCSPSEYRRYYLE